MRDLVWRLSSRREMVNLGNGHMQDVPDEDCVEAVAEITRLQQQVKDKDAEIERLRKALYHISSFDDHGGWMFKNETIPSARAHLEALNKCGGVARAALNKDKP